MIGYTLALVELNRQASQSKLGVKLGKACIKHNISVAEIALAFDVSRTAVYNWFTGKSEPNLRLESAIERYIKKLA